ncbi:MAG: chemotaxis protein CheW [Bacillota bacterium]
MKGKGNSSEYAQDLEILLAEVSDLLQATEVNLVELEKAPKDASLIQEVFRVMHTVKGGAATLGLQEAVEVTHRMESLMDGVRSGQREMTKPLMDTLFAVLDWLKEWRAAMAAGNPSPSPAGITATIEALGDGTDAQGAPAPGAAPGGSSKASLPEDLQKKVQAALQQGKQVLRAVVRFGADTPLLSVRCFQIVTNIEEMAEVVGSVPSMEQIENDQVKDVLEVYFISDNGGDDVAGVARNNPDVQDVKIEKYEVKGQAVAETARGKESGEAPIVKRSDLGKTVRVDVGLLDFLMNMVGELVIDRTRLSQIAAELMARGETSSIGNDVSSLAAHLQRTSTELQEGIMQARLLPLKSILSKFPRMIRDLSGRCGKEIEFEVEGESTELDRTVLEAIDDPLIHVLRNAVDHGIEMPEERQAKGKPRAGHVKLSAWHEENQVLVRVEDDGAGIDAERVKRSAVKKGLITEEQAQKLTEKEAVEMIFLPGFSTADKATEVSGRGVGMDVVRANLERVNGQIEVKTKLGAGTQITLRLPLTLAIMRALLVRCGKDVYAVPTSSVEEVFSMGGFDVSTIQGKPAINVRGRVVPLISLDGALRESMWELDGEKYALLTRNNEQPMALGVDDLIGEEEIVVKEMGRLLSRLKGIAGATILAQGDPAIILDVARVV